MDNVSLKPIIEKLENLFDVLNTKYYNGELEKPVLTVSPNTSSNALGWFTTSRVWKNVSDENESYYEINISAEYLTRTIYEITGTLLHEMAHLYAQQHDIKDTSRGCMYHNKRFKQIAESHGLIIEHHEKYGYTITTLNEETNEFVNSLDMEQFIIHRQNSISEKTKKPRKKSSSRKYICPMCNNIVRSTKEMNILCGECSTENNLIRMELEE